MEMEEWSDWSVGEEIEDNIISQLTNSSVSEAPTSQTVENDTNEKESNLGMQSEQNGTEAKQSLTELNNQGTNDDNTEEGMSEQANGNTKDDGLTQNNEENKAIEDNNVPILSGATECNTEGQQSGRGTQKTDNNENNKGTSVRKPRSTKKRKVKRKRQLCFESSSDDEIPLSILRQTLKSKVYEDSDNDKTYKPNSKELNSSDSEYLSDISDNEKKSRYEKKQLKRLWENSIQRQKKRNVDKAVRNKIKRSKDQLRKRILKQKTPKRIQLDKSAVRITKKTHKRRQKPMRQKQTAKKGTEKEKQHETQVTEGSNEQDAATSKENTATPPSLAEIIKQAKDISEREVELQNSVIQQHECRLIQLLKSNQLRREKVAPYGNCFFDSASISLGANSNSFKLRQDLCNHLEENIEEYTGFLLNKHNPRDQENFLVQHLTELENLRTDGYWSSAVADLLPLALSNYTGRTVIIYTSKESQPIIEVHPTLVQSTQQLPIHLAYIAVPGVSEHYDACEKISAANKGIAANTEGIVNQTSSDNVDSHPQNTDSSTQQTDDANTVINENDTTNEIAAGENSNENDKTIHTTPRKSAIFVTPVKKKLVRKRKATPESWKKNVRKRLRISGKGYVSSTGKVVSEKIIKPVNCTKCKYKCNDNFSQEQRQNIFQSFWSLDTYERKKDFVCGRVEERKTRTYLDDEGRTVPKKKNICRKYSFEKDGEKRFVCKKFFLATLAVGNSYIDNAMSGKSEGRYKGSDKRGKHTPHNKIMDERLQFVREHIKSFPKVASHYTRKDTNREFLGADLTVPRMYALYQEKCEQRSEEPVKLSAYRKVFNTEYNYSFHVPKKDQCNVCSQYHNNELDGTVTEKQREEFNQHQTRKQRAREEKEKDKKSAKQSPTVYTATFDLQSVLYTPCSLVSLMYYMRKLCCYNLSVYGLGNNRGHCYVWSEVDGKRGSCEIGTCLLLHLQSLPMNVQHVVLYSDSCCGQNRNQVIATCLLYAVSVIGHIKTIDHKFLESGHTHMECDSMHSAIEFAKKKTEIYVPSQWDTVITMARRKDPYTVVPLKFQDIIDFKEMKAQRIKHPRKADSGKKANWTKMRWMRYLKDDPDACLYKYDLEDAEFERVKLFAPRRSTEDEVLPRKYKSKLPVSSAKKRDLVQLCRSGVIPSEFHEYYKGLPSSQNTSDRLAEPDVVEEDNDTDID